MAPAQLPVPEPVSSLPEFRPSLPVSDPLLRSDSAPSFPDFRPSLFSGESSECKSFLWQCKLFFELNPSSFPDDERKIVFVLSLLSGRACKWKRTRFPSESTITCTFEEFFNEFTLVFSSKSVESHGLSNIKQGNRSVEEYSEDFRVKTSASGWSDAMLRNIYLNALNKEIRKELATIDQPTTLEELICIATYLDYRLQARVKPRSRKPAQPGPVQICPVQSCPVQPSPTQSSSVLPSTALYSLVQSVSTPGQFQPPLT